MNKFDKVFKNIIKEDVDPRQDVWKLKEQGEKLKDSWDYPNKRPQVGEQFPNEDQLWKDRIEEDKKICKWNQEHGRCLSKYCVFAYCRDEGYDIWDCDLIDNAANYYRYQKTLKDNKE